MRVQAEIEIDRPAGEVFAYISNVENNPLWQRDVSEARLLTEPPLAKGSRYEQVAEFRGRPVVTRFEVTDFVPGRAMTVESIKSPYRIRVTRQVDSLDDSRSRVTVDTESQPGGLARLFQPILRRFARQAVNADYQRLKDLLEESS